MHELERAGREVWIGKFIAMFQQYGVWLHNPLI